MPVQGIVAQGYPAYAPAAMIETPHLVAPSATGCVAAQSCVTIK
jgi:hypothetical protein